VVTLVLKRETNIDDFFKNGIKKIKNSVVYLIIKQQTNNSVIE